MGVMNTVWTVASLAFVAYLANNIYTMYQLFHPRLCKRSSTTQCLWPAIVDPQNRTVHLPVQLRVMLKCGNKDAPIEVFFGLQLRQYLFIFCGEPELAKIWIIYVRITKKWMMYRI